MKRLIIIKLKTALGSVGPELYFRADEALWIIICFVNHFSARVVPFAQDPYDRGQTLARS